MYSMEFMKIITREECPIAEKKMFMTNPDNRIDRELDIIKNLCNIIKQKMFLPGKSNC